MLPATFSPDAGVAYWMLCCNCSGDPSYSGNVYFDADWLNSDDHNIYRKKSYAGLRYFTWYDVRTGQWNNSGARTYDLMFANRYS